MSEKPSVCRKIEPALLAAAMGEAELAASLRVEHHVGRCAPCRVELEQYRAVDALVGALESEPLPGRAAARARRGLESRLADLRRRLLAYSVFPSPLGPILIAVSEQGVSLVEYLARRDFKASRLSHMAGVEAVEGGKEIEPLFRQLLDYLEGRRTRLEWPLDLRLVRSNFHRRVLLVTAGLPYGAVTSYGAIAREVGKPSGVRAVAQALRWNPVPIAIPCHRVIGASGLLTGYAGGGVRLKQRLLAVEGVPMVKADGDFRIEPEVMYVCAPGEREYCLPICGSLRAVKPGRATLFASRQSAEAAGFAPCTTCRPDLHPISR